MEFKTETCRIEINVENIQDNMTTNNDGQDVLPKYDNKISSDSIEKKKNDNEVIISSFPIESRRSSSVSSLKSIDNDITDQNETCHNGLELSSQPYRDQLSTGDAHDNTRKVDENSLLTLIASSERLVMCNVHSLNYYEGLPVCSSSSNVRKKRRRKNEEIPISREKLKEYCNNAISDYPEYGIKGSCDICNNTYDVNCLFRDNRNIKKDDNNDNNGNNKAMKYICLYCSIDIDIKYLKDWSEDIEKIKRCTRCKSTKSLKKYKKKSINYCCYCALKKNRHYGRVLLGLEKQSCSNANKKSCIGDIEFRDRVYVNQCNV